MAKRSLPILSDGAAKKILRDLCKQHNVSLELVTQMIEIQRENLGRGRQIGITQDFSAAIAEFLDSASIVRGE
ncbi:DNA modification system-associated small protein [Caballeronia sp. Sq4a]|uniref:DNA modification system-associated small protein n=1 Tax=Caballeronia sp. Sq4a TaxID=2878152 RepID=UPI0020C0BE2C|nr:DNA modification system-associated small protein [Caballeronia sp. Sq4a]